PVSLGERSRVRFPVYAHVGRCRFVATPRPVSLGGYGRTDPQLNKPFYPNGLVVGILTWPVSLGGYGRTNPLLKQALLSQWSSGWDSDTLSTLTTAV
ncbi:unnamed protein product, partial [Closterium sp. NIES-54]